MASGSTNSLALVPMPRQIEELSGRANLHNAWKVQIATADAADQLSAELLLEEANSGLASLSNAAKGVEIGENAIRIAGVAAPPGMSDVYGQQGYHLRIEPAKILIEAPSAGGRLYGAQTLRQLIRGATSETIPCLDIVDYPDFQWRGISDDISRGQVSTVADFKDTIHRLSFYKKNLYQPYIEDMFRFAVDPHIGAERGAITKAEMAEILAEAQKYHITLCPVFETLGHQDRLLSLPENRKYAEITDPTKTPWSFAPVSHAATEFVMGLIDEVAAATPSPFFHIGGDESWDVGQGASKSRVKKVGAGRVHAEYFTQLHDHIKSKLSRQTMLYSDMLLHHPDSLQSMPRDMILVDWHYDPDDKLTSVKKLHDAGYPVITSPGIWSWDTFYPNFDFAFRNGRRLTQEGRKYGAIGSIMSSWGDNGAENLRENNWTGFAYSAATEWETTAPETDEFIRRYVVTRYGTPMDSEAAKALIQAEKLLGWSVPKGFSTYGQLFHRDVRVKPSPKDQITTMVKLDADMKQVRWALATARDAVRFDLEHLDVLDQVALRLFVMAQRQVGLNRIAHDLGTTVSGGLSPEAQEDIRNTLMFLRDGVLQIAADYPAQWLSRNKFPKLDFNIDRLYRQVGQLQSLLNEADNGTLRAEQPPTGTWMWFPDPDPKTKSTTSTNYFVRLIDVPAGLNSAELRIFADESARVYINGKRAARATYGGGLVVKDVKDMIRPGKNYIAIEASNTYGAAGLLLSLAISSPGGDTVLTGDDHWRVTKTKRPTWMTELPRGKDWLPVKLLGSGLVPPWENIDW